MRTLRHSPGLVALGAVLVFLLLVLGLMKASSMHQESDPVVRPAIASIAPTSSWWDAGLEDAPSPSPSVSPSPSKTRAKPKPIPTTEEPEQVVEEQEPAYPRGAAQAEEDAPWYSNCDAVRAAGAAPIYQGDPGWQSKFDRDGDGVGCES